MKLSAMCLKNNKKEQQAANYFVDGIINYKL